MRFFPFQVWSFGCLSLYVLTREIPYSHGHLSGMQIFQLIHEIASGNAKPDISNAPIVTKGLIAEMLAANPSTRPDFEEIVPRLKRLKDSDVVDTVLGTQAIPEQEVEENDQYFSGRGETQSMLNWMSQHTAIN